MSTPVVLITGALAGIGRATALAFGELQANIVVSGRREEAGDKLVGELRSLGAQAEFFRADVSRELEVEALIAHTVARFGRLDVAVNNAGTEGTNAPLTEQSATNYAAVFETNVLGTILCLKYELRVMLPQFSGSIINLSSTAGSRGMPNAAVYVASKHAVEGLTKVAALEAAPHNVRVNAVAPGPVDTEMLTRFTQTPERKDAFKRGVPLGRLGLPSEIADAIVFLGSEKASFLTGQIIAVNGGKTAS